LMGIRERRGEVFMGVPLDPLIAQIKERAIPTIELRL